MKYRIAQISPNQNAYSETFIQNHKKNFDAQVFYYYNGFIPDHLEGEGYLTPSLSDRFCFYLKKLLRKNLSYNYLTKRSLLSSFKKNKIQLVFAEYGPTGVAMIDICKECNIPLIVNFHGYDASVKSVLDEYQEGYKKMFEYAAYIIVVSKTMQQQIEELGCPPQKMRYITYGPNDNFLTLTPTNSEKAFLSVGRFVDKKAPYYTILSFAKVVNKYPDAKLYMAGNGILLESCRNIVKCLGLRKNVHLLGATNNEELVKYYSHVKAFVQHSITADNGDMEGTPVAILEASAAALPVVSTRHAGIRDVIIENETGLLVDEHDVEGMAKNMIYLLENENEVKRMGDNGRKNIRENYSMEIHAEKLNKLILETLSM